ncbi:peptidylprolyl isomerase [uncultured Fusobacterium sp.]|jgi:peptidyl-prolyl cis-trans isomerase D|uniref:peptidylprolyl isomerase n=1 Tax=uncultured Fusobacterium sp. TaxID=159267 RepID=UPI0015A6FC62|nr:peptidylprolyl isomerase [uncultured Fusobacterium sp.]
MAIRKFRKQMKPIIWFVTILFVLSGSYLTIMNLKGSMSSGGATYAFKLDGEKISKLEVERTKATMIDGYSKYLGDKIDRSLIDIIAFNEVVNKNITLKIADDLKVKVPGSEVSEQYDRIESSIGNREQFKRMLQVQGYTRKSFKEELEKNLIVAKTLEKIRENVVLTEDEIKEFYDENQYTMFNGKKLDEVKDSIVKELKEIKGNEEYAVLLEQYRNKIKLDNIADEYFAYVEKPELESDGFVVTNLDMARKTLQNLFLTNGDREKARELSKEYYDNQFKLAKEAVARGIKVDENLPLDYKFAEYNRELFENIKNSLNPTDEQLKEFFNKNRMAYDVFPSSDAYIAILKVDPSEADKAAAKEKANELLKKLTVENFADMARENTDEPNSNGGDLGWFSKKDMVEPFQKAVFEGEVGKIYPEPVETVFGQHLIYIADRNDEEERAKASHILVTPKISQETLEQKEKELGALKAKLIENKVKFEDLAKENKDVLHSGLYSNINDAGYIPNLGYNSDLTKLIFKAPINKIETAVINDTIFIFEKVKEVKYKAADFNENKAKIKDDYLNYQSQEEMKKLI